MEHVIYNSENSKWYRHDHSFAVRNVKGKATLPPDPGVTAMNYVEAFEAVFGAPYEIPAPVRAARRESVLA
jgi:hypothetical protein